MNSAVFFFLNLFAESSLLVGAALLVTAKASARVRVLMLRCAFFVVLLSPVATLFAANDAGVFIVKVPITTLTQSNHSRLQNIDHETSHANQRMESMGRVAESVPLTLVAAMIWALGALLVLAKYVYSLAYLSRSFASGTDLPVSSEKLLTELKEALGVTTPVYTRFARNIASPCTFGWLQAKVLLPLHLSRAEPLYCAILAHELCHIRNRDTLWIMLGQLMCSLCWFNPLVWLAVRIHREAIEFVCDNDATETAIEIDDYVTALVDASRSIRSVSYPAAVMMSAGGLTRRLRTLIAREHPIPRLSRAASASIVAVSVGILVLSSFTRIVSAQERAPPPKSLESIDIGTWLGSLKPKLAPYEAMLYVNAGRGVTVRSTELGFMCAEGSCGFTVPAHGDLTLTVVSDGKVRWVGCAPSLDDNRRCVVHMTGEGLSVRAFIQNE
jgi:beta-lactamase regulating signal transducer with metallopeptidase domain